MKRKILALILVIAASLPLVNADIATASKPAARACESTDGKKCVRVGQPCPKKGDSQVQRLPIGASRQLRSFTCANAKGKLRWKEEDIGFLMFWSFDNFELRYESRGYPLRVHDAYCSLRYSPTSSKSVPKLQVRYTTPGLAELMIYSSCGASVTNMSDAYRLQYTPALSFGVFLLRELGVDELGRRFSGYNAGDLRCQSNCNGLAPGATAELWSDTDAFLIRGTRSAIEKLYGDLVDATRRMGLDRVAFQIQGRDYGDGPRFPDPPGCHVLGASASVSVISSYRLSQFGDAKSCEFPDVSPIW